MRWTAPPDRREITLILLSLLTYFFAYNLDTSFEILGIDPVATQGAVYRRLGLGKKSIGPDGRKPAGWRDKLEADIYGDWQWDQGHVAGDGQERSQPKGTGRHGATWISEQQLAKASKPLFGEAAVDNALQRWGDDIPQTRLVKHVPGYTILENVHIFNGSVYLITDSKQEIPPISAVASIGNEFFKEWNVLTTQEGRKVIGKYGSTIRGVSWMSSDSTPNNSTLFALWRTYSSLDTSIDSSGRTKLAPPHRLIFPQNHFFTDPNPDFDQYLIRRRRVDTGFHPYLAKAAFPQLTVQYFEDWEDYHKLAVPFMYERLIIADREAAQKTVINGMPAVSSASMLDSSSHWWEPIRRNVAQFIGEYEVSPKAKPVVTYIHSQSESGLKLSGPDHDALASALRTMGKNYGYEVHIVSADTGETDWVERMTAVVKSSIILGVYGNHMADIVYMRPSPQSTVMEFFPSNKYAKDQEVASHMIGLKYTAWWGSQSFITDYPSTEAPKNEQVSIDTVAVVRAIHEALSKAS